MSTSIYIIQLKRSIVTNKKINAEQSRKKELQITNFKDFTEARTIVDANEIKNIFGLINKDVKLNKIIAHRMGK